MGREEGAPVHEGTELGEAGERRTPEERKALLATQLQQAVFRGRRIETQADFQATLIEGKPVNHILHLILTLVTCLVWGVVWIALAIFGGEKRELVQVDEWGNVLHQAMGRV